MKTAFLGTPRLAQIVLGKLIESPYRPHLVVTAPDTKAGRGQKFRESPVKQTALEYKIALSSQLLAVGHDIDLAILVAYGKLIPKEILEIPKFGFVNIHPSLLPKYRGPSPIQTAIFKNEGKTGVSIIVLDEILDHGPILAQKEVPIDANDTHESLIEKLGEIGADLLIGTLPKYLNGSLKPKNQDHLKATYTKKINKADGEIDPNKPPDSKTLDRMIRAFYPWPTVWCRLIINGKSQVVKFLPRNLIQPEGKRPMTVREFLNGYKEARKQFEKILLGLK